MEAKRLKLYKVTLQGMTISASNSVAYGKSYVVAESPNEAYHKIKDFLDKEDIGFCSERELRSIEVIADTYRYNDVGCLLFV